MSTPPVLLICMGVSGSGKTTLARRLSGQLDMEFLDADDFHSTENKNHMARGLGLSDAMRTPWIEAMCGALRSTARDGRSYVLAYSGLKRAHRQRFRELGYSTLFLYLHSDQGLLKARLDQRGGHFVSSSLLDSQLADMEQPEHEPDIEILANDSDLDTLLELALQATHSFSTRNEINV